MSRNATVAESKIDAPYQEHVGGRAQQPPRRQATQYTGTQGGARPKAPATMVHVPEADQTVTEVVAKLNQVQACLYSQTQQVNVLRQTVTNMAENAVVISGLDANAKALAAA